MLGLVITLAVAAAPVTSPASVTCVEGPTACEPAPAPFEAMDEALDGAFAEPFDARAFATPAVIDCRRELVPLVLSTLVGECDGTPHDASYRVSRTADDETRTQVLAPAPRDKRLGVATVGGVPPRAPGLTFSEAQPVAISGTPTLVPPATTVRQPGDTLPLPTRFADPPDRPPRPRV